VDLLGHGRSDPGDAGQLSVGDHARRIVAFMHCLGLEQATLVGHGFGADVAIRTAHDFPARVRKLALVSPLCGTRLPLTMLYQLARWRRLATQLPLIVFRQLSRRALLAGYSSKGQVQPEHSVGLYLRPYESRAGVATMLGQIAAVDRDGGPVVAGVPSDLDVAIAWGDADPFVSPEVVERLQSAIARSTLDRINGGSHFLPEEVPERVASFLSALLER
jgi:pimeloyl-ACP methyl ester carboxylesterase